MSGGDIVQRIVDAYDGPGMTGRAEQILAAHDREVAAQALREAALETDWTWGTFVAADGVMSVGMHGKTPSELLRDRAARLTATTDGTTT